LTRLALGRIRLVPVLLRDARPAERRPDRCALHGLPRRRRARRVRPRRSSDHVRPGAGWSVLDGKPDRGAPGLVPTAGRPRELEARFPGASRGGHRARVPHCAGRRDHTGADRRRELSRRARPEEGDVHGSRLRSRRV